MALASDSHRTYPNPTLDLNSESTRHEPIRPLTLPLDQSKNSAVKSNSNAWQEHVMTVLASIGLSVSCQHETQQPWDLELCLLTWQACLPLNTHYDAVLLIRQP
jgi:hypothetical protein